MEKQAFWSIREQRFFPDPEPELWKNLRTRRRYRRLRISRHQRYLRACSRQSGPFAAEIKRRIQAGRSNAEMGWLYSQEIARFYTPSRPDPHFELEWWGSESWWWPYPEDEWEPAPQSAWVCYLQKDGPSLVVEEVRVLEHRFQESGQSGEAGELHSRAGFQLLPTPAQGQRLCRALLQRGELRLELAFWTDARLHWDIYTTVCAVAKDIDWSLAVQVRQSAAGT